jgi:LacI family transcriptional regulator
MPAPATLQDVADQARVHRSTVALALRNHPRIPAATRARIQQVAVDLGYRINPLVAALMHSRRTGRTGRSERHTALAFVTTYPTRYGWRQEYHDRPDFFPGAVQRAKDFGYNLEHFWLAEPGMTPSRFCDILVTRGVNGVIVGRMPPGQNSLDLAWDRFSCVALGMTLRSPQLHHVTENHFETCALAMRQCLQRGYRRVGFVFSEANDSPWVGDRWLAAYLLHQGKLKRSDRIPICPGETTDFATFARWFRRTKPDALLVTHARPVLAWLRELKSQVPRDVGLVELQDDPLLGSTGVYYDPAKIGSLAVEMLVGLMHRNETGVPRENYEVMLSGEWREGRTLPPLVSSSAAKSRKI